MDDNDRQAWLRASAHFLRKQYPKTDAGRERLADGLDEIADALEAKDAEIKRLEVKLEVVPENERGRAWFGNEGLDCRTGRLVAAKCL